MIIDQLQKLAHPIEMFTFDPYNARVHPEDNMEAIKASLKKFGQRKPIVVQKTNEALIVRAGNGTLAAAKALGWKKVAAIIIEEDDATASAFAVADNRSSELSGWDDHVLLQTLDNLKSTVDLADLGFDNEAYAKLAEKVEGSLDTSFAAGAEDTQEYLLIVTAKNEKDQQALFEDFQKRGLECKIMS